MRCLVVAVVCLGLIAGLTVSAGAVGLQAVGKEDCVCSPLVARGVVPDTLNSLHEALYFPSFMQILDQLASDVRVVLAQFGPIAAAETTESAAPTESIKETKDKAAAEEKSGKEEKLEKEEKPAKEKLPAVDKKKPTTRTKKIDNKKKKVKVPPQAR